MDHTTGGSTDRYRIRHESELVELLKPETELEWTLLQHPDFCRGLMWGEPRFGHPEGKVALHVREVMDNVDQLDVDEATRRRLRLIALVHDAFKCDEDKDHPRDWSRHHSVLARRFLENYTSDKAVLDIIELHDEAYYAWRTIHLYKEVEKGMNRMQRLFDRLDGNLDLYYLFLNAIRRLGIRTRPPCDGLKSF